MKKIINGLCIILGFLCIGLGVVGIILPVLPATPFLILAAVLFAKGSSRFHRWFIQTKLHKNYVEPAMGKRAMDRGAKVKALITLFIIFSVSFILVPIWFVKIIILAVALFHFYYFGFKIKTAAVRREEVRDYGKRS